MGILEIQRLKEQAKQPKPPKRYTIPNKSAKKLAQEKELRNFPTITSPNAELQRWFEERRKEMTGICSHCGGKTTKDSDQYYKFSIAHILPKAYFKSIKTHQLNWIELCHFGNSCHANFDNHHLDLVELNCFNEVVEKFTKMYPEIAPQEKRRIPSVLVEYYEANK